MHKNLLVILFLALTCNVFSQNWLTDFEKAKALAATNHQNIVLVFQGSDWCGPCIKLDREVWSTAEFKQLAKDHFVMLKADFPRKKSNRLTDDQAKQNAKLAETYNTQGFFPFVVVMDSKGEVLGKTGYEKTTPVAYFKKLTAFEK